MATIQIKNKLKSDATLNISEDVKIMPPPPPPPPIHTQPLPMLHSPPQSATKIFASICQFNEVEFYKNHDNEMKGTSEGSTNSSQDDFDDEDIHTNINHLGRIEFYSIVFIICFQSGWGYSGFMLIR